MCRGEIDEHEREREKGLVITDSSPSSARAMPLIFPELMARLFL